MGNNSNLVVFRKKKLISAINILITTRVGNKLLLLLFFNIKSYDNDRSTDEE